MTKYGDKAGALTARHDSSPCADRGQNIIAQLIAFPERMSGTQRATSENISPSLMAKNPTAVAYGIPGNWVGRKPENGGNATTPMEDVAPCLTKTDVHGVSYGLTVRRLTPVECERLQGFPDDYTRIPWRGKPAEKCPDAPRYKAIGNSMAVPVMRRIGERIRAVENIKRELSIAEESA